MAIRSGREYIEALSGTREVWLGGERVEDVATHPAFSSGAQAVAALYDLQSDPAFCSCLTFREAGDSDLYASTFKIPNTISDLKLRRKAVDIWARATFGTFGRSPDFFNIAITAFAAAHEFFSQWHPERGGNVLKFYDHVKRNNLFLTRATIAPQVNRSLASFEQLDPFSNLRVVKETDAGLIVRGAKMISTNAAIADELLVFPLPGLQPGDEPYALSFSIPISTPGLRLICRQAYNSGDRTRFDHPLSSRFEEIDTTCVFDNVLVPWDRVFFHGTVEVANVLYGETMARNHAGHQAMARALVKSELLAGIAIALAESTKTSAFLHVQQMLGELLGDLEVVRALLTSAEDEASISQWGNMCPAIDPIQAFRCVFPRINARAIEAIQTLGGGGFFSAPSEADINSPVAGDIARYLQGAAVSATDRIQLLKLAWDITGDSFGQRQKLYERYHAGDPVRIAASQFHSYDKVPLLNLVTQALSNLSEADSTVPASHEIAA